MNKKLLRQIRWLPNADKLLLARACLLGILIKIRFKIAGFNRVIRSLERSCKNAEDIDLDDTGLKRYRRLLVLTERLRPFLGINCLDISVTFWFLMKKNGIKTNMQFGVAKNGNIFKSHSWLEYKGFPLIPNSLTSEKFAPFSKAIV